MSLLVPATISGSTRRIALYEISDKTYPYFHELISYGPVKIATKRKTGGYFQPQFGDAEILATAFSTSGPPPTTISLPAYLMTSSGDVLIADATGQTKEINPASVTYELYGTEYDATTATGDIAANDTLVDYFTWACDPARLNLTLDSSLATDYDIDFSLTNERLIIEILDELAESLSHGFYIDGGTLYLIDLAKNNGTIALSAKYDFFDDEVKYSAPVPYSIFKNGEYSVAGTYSHGKEYTQSNKYQTLQAAIEVELARKKVLLDKWWIEIVLPVGDNSISYGQKITFTDSSKFTDLTVEMWARDFHYELDTYQERLTIAGEGTLS